MRTLRPTSQRGPPRRSQLFGRPATRRSWCSGAGCPRRSDSMNSDRHVTVGALASALERRLPAQWAEEWDRVGLVIGDPKARATGVLVTLDATAEAVQRAVQRGASVLVTHHPPYLDVPEA